MTRYFVIEDLDNTALYLLKNALGGNRRNLVFREPYDEAVSCRSIRDDIAVQVLFSAYGEYLPCSQYGLVIL